MHQFTENGSKEKTGEWNEWKMPANMTAAATMGRTVKCQHNKDNML